MSKTLILRGGRLWKRDRRSASVLLFAEIGIFAKLSTRGFLLVRGMTGRHHDHGYDLARDAVVECAARKPGALPIVSMVATRPSSSIPSSWPIA